MNSGKYPLLKMYLKILGSDQGKYKKRKKIKKPFLDYIRHFVQREWLLCKQNRPVITVFLVEDVCLCQLYIFRVWSLHLMQYIYILIILTICKGFNMASQKGIIAFLDIMGYKKIIENNEIEYVAKIISDIMVKLPLQIEKILKDEIGISKEKFTPFKEIDVSVITDSIIIFLPINKQINKQIIGMYWLFFIVYISFLFKKTFDEGLPLRGAIDYGDFYKDQYCFAGKPLIRCHELSKELQFAGCVFTKECNEIFNKQLIVLSIKRVINYMIFPYKAPLKNDKFEVLTVVNWLYKTFYRLKHFSIVEQYIKESFQKHNRNLVGEVLLKVKNTEDILHKSLSLIKEQMKSLKPRLKNV